VARLGRARAEAESEDARRLARWVTLHPAGFAVIDPEGFRRVEGIGLKAFGAVLATVSGREYPPRRERIERLYHELAVAPSAGRCLGGCFIAPRRGKILICREPAAVAPPVALARGMWTRWDGRYELFLDRAAPAALSVGALGSDFSLIREQVAGNRAMALPAVVRASQAALRSGKDVVAVPLLGYFGQCREKEATRAACRVRFRPSRSLTGAGFRIV
jgi:tRNA(Ile)-lysidine synthase